MEADQHTEERALAVIAASCLRPGDLRHCYLEHIAEHGPMMPVRFARLLQQANAQLWTETVAALRGDRGAAT